MLRLFLITSVLSFGLADSPAGDASALFQKSCASCHGKDGKAKTPIAKKLGVKDLSQSKLADPEIERQILKGRKRPDGIQIMPSFEGQFTAGELADLIAVVKKFRTPAK